MRWKWVILMKVKELIEELQKCDPDSDVYGIQNKETKPIVMVSEYGTKIGSTVLLLPSFY